MYVRVCHVSVCMYMYTLPGNSYYMIRNLKIVSDEAYLWINKAKRAFKVQMEAHRECLSGNVRVTDHFSA